MNGDGFSWDKFSDGSASGEAVNQEVQDILGQLPNQGGGQLPEFRDPLQEMYAPAPQSPTNDIEIHTFSQPDAGGTYFAEPTHEAAPAPASSPFESPAASSTPNVFQQMSAQAPEPAPQPAYNPNHAAEVKSDDIQGQHERELMQEDSSAQDIDGIHIDDILRAGIERRASDIHFTVGLPPMGRIDGEVDALPFKMLKPNDTRRLLYEIIDNDQMQKFETTHELDMAYMVRGLGRFRVNMYMQRGAVAAALRSIPSRIPSFDELNLPETIREIAKRHSGLILVTGPTGSGKSTTIASMIDDINEVRTGHIVTIEDPIEYLHQHKKCMVNQREMHADTYSFHNALRAVLREDPDIILVGELRDLETIEAALTLAETGHLVFGTLHTRNAPSTIDRVVDVFPSDQQAQIRVLLGNTIEGIISQQLLPKIGGGRIAALEIMTGTAAVKNMIREGKTHQMYSIIETSKKEGMITMDSSLASLVRSGIVHYEECLMRAVDKDSFARLAQRAAA